MQRKNSYYDKMRTMRESHDGNQGRKFFQEARRGHQLQMLQRDGWQREKDTANKKEGHLGPQ